MTRETIANPTIGAGLGSNTIRLAHFSDLHVTHKGPGWKPRDLFSKRLPGWINLRLFGRAFRFRHAHRILEVLSSDLLTRGINHQIFSGDATALGFEKEVERAAHLLRVGLEGHPPGLAVPGNHDYFTDHSVLDGAFERHFAAWQQGKRIDGHTYPFAQKVGHAWLIGVNSCTSNKWAWDASGAVGEDQLKRLERLLSDLGEGVRVLVTHYPVLRANRRREPRVRALRDLDRLLEVASRGGIQLWLHGHRHDRFHHCPTEGHVPFPVVCAGSATQSGRWSYAEYTLTGNELVGSRRVFNRQSDRFEDQENFRIELTTSPLAKTGSV